MTRGIKADLKGSKYGNLTVLGYAGTDDHKNAIWKCFCECGKEVKVRAAFLKKGQTFCGRDCDIYRNSLVKDITGQQFGELTAIELIGFDGARKSVWNFSCSCGNTKAITSDRVLSGNSKTCGEGIHYPGRKHGLSHTKEMKNAWSRAYKCKKSLRVPSWVTQEMMDEMIQIYKQAKRVTLETGVPHEVDHFYPLGGKLVSGLHVPNNLRIVTKTDNRRKTNKLIDEIC